MELIGPYLIGAGLLVVAGVAKTLQPADTARAMATLLARPGHSAPPGPWVQAVVRAGALMEVAIGLVALAVPRTATAVLVALSYGVFTGVVAVARWRGGSLSSCGCFGRPDVPATVLHLLLNLAFAATALAVSLHAPQGGTVLAVLTHQPMAGLPLLFVSAVGLYLSYLALSPLAAVAAVRR